MKKLLLVISFIILSIFTTFAAGLNAYAFGAGYIHDTNTNQLHISWSQQAVGDVTIVALDANDNRYVLAEFEDREAKLHDEIIDLWNAVAAGMPTNTDLRVAIEVRTEDQTPSKTKHDFVKKIDFKWPFSIDIDRNPYSKYFGLMYVGQVNSSNDRGIYVLDQQGGLARGAQIDKDITLYNLWYDETHAVPYMVRTLQDGTGRLLISSADKSQNTHLWLATPQTGDAVPVYSEWTDVVTSSKLRDWTGHGVAKDYFSNAGLDIRENGDYWDILLYMSTASSGTANHDGGNAYSGVYRVAKSSTDLTGGTYISYTAPTPNSSYPSGFKPHDVISNEYTSSVFNASANFDMFGGVMYNATSEGNNADKSAFIHRTLNGTFKADYADGDYLKRGKARTKGARFSSDFSKFAIAQGRMADELRIYDVSQADGNSHVTLSNGQSVNIITGTSGVTNADRVFVHDIAWDYAMNVYASVRNESSKYGIYVVATDLNGEPIITPIKGTFNVTCPEGEEKFTISLSSNINEAGTLTGAGTYASCTQVTVTATPDDKHKFLRWSENGVEVSKEQSYTFYATKNRNLVAEFEYAEYTGITWHNLLIGETPEGDKYDIDTNQELWEMMMRAHNEYVYDSILKNDFRDKTIDYWTTAYYRGRQEINLITTFFDPTYGQAALVGFMTSPTSPFKWLGDYILEKTGETSFTKQFWAVNIAGFFNCNQLTQKWSNVSYTSKNYATIGTPSEWLPYYRAGICGLEHTMTYTDKMPISIDSLTLEHNGTFPYNNGTTSTVTRSTRPTWYIHEKNEDHTLLLAWRNGSTEGEIEHNISDNNMSLYATWVNKHIQENNPNDEASNYDVITLMKNHTDATHRLTITRKLQGGMYNTICMPFTLRLEGLMNTHPLYGAKAYDFTGINPLYNEETNESVTVLNFTEVNTLEAGKPYLIMPLKDVTEDMLFTGVSRTDLTLEPQSKTVIYGDNELKISFHGVINPTDIRAGGLMVVANNRLAVNTQDYSTMAGMRGYFTIDFTSLAAEDLLEQAQNGRVYLSMRKPTTTSVPLAPEAEQPAQPKVQKIMHDGKIYILRGDEVYTITGARVK